MAPISGTAWQSIAPVGPRVTYFVDLRLMNAYHAVLLFIGSRVSDVGYPGQNRYAIDRQWAIAAAGADFDVFSGNGLSAAMGAKGGALWSRDVQAGVIGTPASQFGPTNWEPKAGIIIDAAATQRNHSIRELGIVRSWSTPQ